MDLERVRKMNKGKRQKEDKYRVRGWIGEEREVKRKKIRVRRRGGKCKSWEDGRSRKIERREGRERIDEVGVGKREKEG